MEGKFIDLDAMTLRVVISQLFDIFSCGSLITCVEVKFIETINK